MSTTLSGMLSHPITLFGTYFVTTTSHSILSRRRVRLPVRPPVLVVGDGAQRADDARQILEVLEEPEHGGQRTVDLDRRPQRDMPAPRHRRAMIARSSMGLAANATSAKTSAAQRARASRCSRRRDASSAPPSAPSSELGQRLIRRVGRVRHASREAQGKCRDSTVRGEAFQAGERFGHVAAAEAEPKVVAGVAELRRRENQHAFPLDEPRREVVDVGAEEFRKPDARGARTHPREPFLVSVEESVEQRQVRRR